LTRKIKDLEKNYTEKNMSKSWREITFWFIH